MKLIDFDEYFSNLSKRDQEMATRRYNELLALYEKSCEVEEIVEKAIETQKVSAVG